MDEICIIPEDKGQEGAYHASKADGRRYESVLNLVNRTGVFGVFVLYLEWRNPL